MPNLFGHAHIHYFQSAVLIYTYIIKPRIHMHAAVSTAHYAMCII